MLILLQAALGLLIGLGMGLLWLNRSKVKQAFAGDDGCGMLACGVLIALGSCGTCVAAQQGFDAGFLQLLTAVATVLGIAIVVAGTLLLVTLWSERKPPDKPGGSG